MKEFRVRFDEKAACAADALQKITGRKERAEVVIDALRTYEWIVYQETMDRIIVSRNDKSEDEVVLERFIAEGKKEEAKKYFEKGKETL